MIVLVEVLLLVPAVFSHTGQINGEFKTLVKEQIKQKLIAFEGDAKSSKIRLVMKWWSKCISVVIAKTASRNVAFKVAKMREAIMEDQDEFVMRNTGHTEVVGLEADNAALLEDVVQNSDLYSSCILPIKTSIRKLRCIACVQTCIALNDVVLGISS